MPIPQPRAGETREAFVARFMADPKAREEWPDEAQRAAVAFRTWRDSLRKQVGRDGRARKATQDEPLGMHVVGPAAPPFDPARVDPATAAEHGAWSSARSALVEIGKRFGILKADERPVPAPTALPDADQEGRQVPLVEATVIEPPYSFEVLGTLHENSHALRNNIDAMVTNVDGFGFRLDPVIDFSHPKVEDRVRDLLLGQAIEAARVDLDSLDEALVAEHTPDPKVARDRTSLWERIATIERGRLENWFKHLNPDPLMSFTEMRRATRESLELFGNAAWEIVREEATEPGKQNGRIRAVHLVPTLTFRLVAADSEPTRCRVLKQKDAVTWVEEEVSRYFRRFASVTLTTRVFYKELGDPRVVSRETGERYSSVEQLREREPDGRPANEVLHWKVRSPLWVAGYGVPRFVGGLLAILGGRASEEVNFLFFDNKAIPPMAILVSGGRLSQSSVEKIERTIKEGLKGRDNFWKVLVLEALPADAEVGETEASGRMRIEIKPLMGEIQKDALWQAYESNNVLKVGRTFRLPPLLTGDQRDANRSTSDAVRAVAEEQVFQPERDAFDAVMDRVFLANQRARFWRFRTNAPVQRIPNDLVRNALAALSQGAITPNECRLLLSDAFSLDFERRPEDWANVPPKLAQEAARLGALPSAEPLAIGDDVEEGLDRLDPSVLEPEPVAGPAPEGLDAEKSRGDTLEQVPDAKGELVARGRTSESAGHSHAFVAVREGSGYRVVTMPGGEDGHVHLSSLAPVSGGRAETEVPEHDGHSHRVAFSVAVRARSTARRKVARGALGAIRALRNLVREEMDAGLDDYFDPETIAREGEDSA